jgi:branched-chain amino acid transport system substrate-binding protein
MFMILDGQSVIRLADNCAGIGYNPRYAVTPHTAADNLLRSPHLDGAIVPALTAPWFLSTHPAIAEFHQAMGQYAPGVPVDGSASHGWTSAKLLERALRGIEGEPTPESILAALRAVAGDDLGGLTQPLTFEAGAPNNAAHMARCFWIVTIAAGQWTSPDGGQRHCD